MSDNGIVSGAHAGHLALRVIQYHRTGVLLRKRRRGTARVKSLIELRFMGAIVNLRVARKRAKRLKAEQEVAVNRLAHGRPKAGQNLERARRDKERRSLDQHRIDMGDGQ